MSDAPDSTKPPVDEQSIRAEFERRRTREQIGTMVFVVSLIASIVGAPIAAQSETVAKTLICVVPILFGGLIFGMIVFSATNWCCPACNYYLSTTSNRISPFFTPDPLKCPNCRIRLR